MIRLKNLILISFFWIRDFFSIISFYKNFFLFYNLFLWIDELVFHLNESFILKSVFESIFVVFTFSSDSKKKIKWSTNSDFWIRRNSKNENYLNFYFWKFRSQVRSSNSIFLKNIISFLIKLILSDTTKIQNQKSMIMNRSKSIFIFCECFFEKRVISTAKWFKKLKHELNSYKKSGVIFSKKYMNSINFFLIDDAAEWAETNVETADLLFQKNFIFESVISFRNLFQKKFFVKTVKIFNISFDTKLKEMKQKSNEIINSYHKRFLILMLKYEIKNRFLTENLFFLKFVILNVIMKIFVRGLLNDEIKKKTIRELFAAKKFFRKLCSLTKNVDRSKKKFQKFMKKKNKFRKLKFYKNMMQRFMSKDRFEVMLINYKTNSVFTDWMQINFFSQNSQKYERSQTVSSSAVVIKSVFLNSSTKTENSLFFESPKTVFYSSQSRWNEFSNKNFFHKFIFKKLSAVSTSKNSYVNESKIWIFESETLCVKCDETEHISKNCNDIMLSTWKQFYLKNIVFENIFQVNFCVADYETYDENVLSYEKKLSKKSSQYHSKSSFSKTEIHVFEFVSFVIYEVSNDFLFQNLLTFFKILFTSVRFVSVNALYEKKSESNKRFHMKFFASESEKKKRSKKKTHWNQKKNRFSIFNEHVQWCNRNLWQISFRSTDIEE